VNEVLNGIVKSSQVGGESYSGAIRSIRTARDRERGSQDQPVERGGATAFQEGRDHSELVWVRFVLKSRRSSTSGSRNGRLCIQVTSSVGSAAKRTGTDGESAKAAVRGAS
jgi:hypothetical protein